jgi:hypothetical protein
MAVSGSCAAQLGHGFSTGLRWLLKRRPEARLWAIVLRARKDLRKPPWVLLTSRAARKTSIKATAVIARISKPSAITSVPPYLNTRFAKDERFSTMASSIGQTTWAAVEQPECPKPTCTVYLGMASMSANVPIASLSNRLNSPLGNGITGV